MAKYDFINIRKYYNREYFSFEFDEPTTNNIKELHVNCKDLLLITNYHKHLKILTNNILCTNK